MVFFYGKMIKVGGFMEKRNVLRLTDVLTVSMDICEAIYNEPYQIVGANLNLVDENGVEKRYSSFSICKESEQDDARLYLNSCNGMSLQDYIERVPYHHICTFRESSEIGNEISFDMNDDVPIKFGLHVDEDLLLPFFYQFNEYRNSLVDSGEEIDNHEIVNQMNEFIKKRKLEERKKRSIFQKVKSRFSKN